MRRSNLIRKTFPTLVAAALLILLVAAWPLAGGTNIRASNEPPALLNAHLESSSDPV